MKALFLTASVSPKLFQIGTQNHDILLLNAYASIIQEIGFQDQLSLNAGQKYCRMLQLEHSAILSTFIKLQFVIKIFALSVFEWPFYTCFTVFKLTSSTVASTVVRSKAV